ncbi:hypothetical protein LCGC14_1673380 [marine sediment metagenome]|uniref:Uncharacterized protein n=1 Tax=marine sediment metagenome TaxID=412755 RepID=A0A0F9HRF9_9ZZZZ|nr:MAG: hypothetical protein Lokiarch_47120 [Candidatus Lokiarchaeum sp. GC14_75]
MGAGKVFAIIGGLLGVLSVVLYYIAPDILNLWNLNAPLVPLKVYLGGFGAWSGEWLATPFPIEYAGDLILLIVGVLTIGGGVITFIGGAAGSKTVGILGGIILLAGPILLLVALIAKLGIFGDTIVPLMGDVNLLFGSIFGVADWGIGIGSYLAIGGGILGIVGGATT